MKAKDVMRAPVVTIHQSATIAELTELLQTAHVSGVPVVDADGAVIGVVTEKDVLYGGMGGPPDVESGAEAPGIRVEEIMTSPAVCATEETELAEICRMMWRFHIHRIPIVRDQRPVGIVAAMDLVRIIAEGVITP